MSSALISKNQSADDRRLKVLFLMKGPNHYRCAFFDLLAQSFDLTVLFTTNPIKAGAIRGLDFYKGLENASYRYVFCDGFQMGKFKVAYSIPSIAKEHYDCIVVGLLDDLIALQYLSYLNHNKIDYLLSFDGIGRDNLVVDAVNGHFIKRASGFLSPNQLTDSYISKYADNPSIFRYPLSSYWEKDIDLKITTRERKNRLKNEFGFIGSKPLILSVGQMIPRKGFESLITAMDNVDVSCNVVMVGGEPYAELSELANMRRDSHCFFFRDKISPDKVANYYRAADVFVLATKGDSWGLVVPEAMSHGLPVITTTKCGSAFESITEKNGAIVEPDDVRELARQINHFISDLDNVDVADASFNQARKFTIEKMSSSCVQAIYALSERRMQR